MAGIGQNKTHNLTGIIHPKNTPKRLSCKGAFIGNHVQQSV